MRKKILIQHRLLYFKLYMLSTLLDIIQPFNSNLPFFLPTSSLWKIHNAFILLKKSKKLYLLLQKKLNDENHIFKSPKEMHLLYGTNSHIDQECWNIYFILRLVVDCLNENLAIERDSYSLLSDNFRNILDKINYIFGFQENIALLIAKYGDIGKQELDRFQFLLEELKSSDNDAPVIHDFLVILDQCKDTVKKQSTKNICSSIAVESNIHEFMLGNLVKNVNYYGKKLYGAGYVNGKIILYFLSRVCKPNRIMHLFSILLSNYQNLTQMHDRFKNAQKMVVRSVGKDKHDYLLRLQMLYAIHSSWFSTLEEMKNKNLPSSIYSDLSIARLIFRKKNYYSAIYQKVNADHTLIYQKLFDMILQHDTTVANIISSMEAQLTVLRSKNLSIEIELNNKLKSKSIALILLLLTENFFFKMGNELYITLEEITHTERFRNIPILNVKMEKNFLNFFASLNGAIFLGAEIYGSAWSGLSYNMIHLITPIFFSDFAFLTRCFKFFKRDEITAIQCLPTVAWLEGMLVFSLFYASLYGVNPAIMGYFIVSYTMSTASRQLFTLLFDKLTNNKNAIQSNMFLKTLVQYFGYLAGAQVWHNIFPHVKGYFTVYERNELLSDKQLCLADKQRCRQYAAEILDLDINANSMEIRKRFRELALLTHPDKEHLGNSNTKYSFFQLVSAKQRLLELNTEPLNNYKFSF